MPACAVTSRKRTCWAWLTVIAVRSNIHHGDTEARISLKRNFISTLRLLQRWRLAGLCPTGESAGLRPHASMGAPAAVRKYARGSPAARCYLRDATADRAL